MSAGMAKRPCTDASVVMYEMSVTATGADFWAAMMVTAMRSLMGSGGA